MRGNVEEMRLDDQFTSWAKKLLSIMAHEASGMLDGLEINE